VKTLPKDKRKRLVPVPDCVDRALAELTPGDRELTAALSAVLGRIDGVTLAPGDWDPGKLEDFYRMNVRVVDADGKLLAEGRNLARLIEAFRGDTRQSVAADRRDSPAREGIQRWDFGELPGEWRFRQAGVEILAFPALVDRGDSAAVELLDYAGSARRAHRLGVLRLVRLQCAQTVKYLRKQLFKGNAASLALAGAGLAREALVEDLIDAACVQACGLDGELPRTEPDFEALLKRGRGALVARAVDLESALLASLDALAAARRRLSDVPAGQWADSIGDMHAQVAGLWSAGCLRDAPAEWLAQYPRYMQALLTRVERLAGQYPKDRQHLQLLQSLGDPLRWLRAGREGIELECPAACRYRWMLEELRVSLFAQHLGTRLPVSRKRLEEQWAGVAEWLAAHPR